MCCIVGLTTVGALDDRFDLSVKIRMLVQTIISISISMIYFVKAELVSLGNILGFGEIALSYSYLVSL
jgi:UDP-GlcNAc:undecaprenyl-phosphate GlcNAc-1-phosphate transferase